MKNIQKTGQILLIGNGPNGLVLIGKIVVKRPCPPKIVFPKAPEPCAKTDLGIAPSASADGAFFLKKIGREIKSAHRRSAHKK